MLHIKQKMGSGYFWLYDEESDLSSRPQMYVLLFTDAHSPFHRCSQRKRIILYQQQD